MHKSIAIFAPQDRFNYGDLLFAIMLEYGLNKTSPGTFRFQKYGLVKADFSDEGGFNVFSYKRLKKDLNQGKTDAIIVAGGECLRADWNGLYSFINPLYFKLFRHPRIPFFFKKSLWVRSFLGGVSDNPFLINKSDFQNDFQVIYNLVGGGYNLPSEKLNRLKKADYISFREKASAQFTSEKLQNHEVFLVPDSAIIMEDIYPKDDFLTSSKIPVTIRNILQTKYIFFQISKYKSDNKLDEIALQLKNIAETTGMKVILCPIGTAKGHEDHIPLKMIYQKIKEYAIFIDHISLESIMALIAYAQLYIGNSLHGVITAMSYGLPYIALNKKQIKLKYYLECWAPPELMEIQDVDDFKNQAEAHLSNSFLGNKIRQKTEVQKDLYYQSLQRISNTILKNERG
ncbi:polysaccharide pyruvyl transferase family protein [Chryseobacterium sp. MFBS3-17]|uniref:polysaccharide pyruvyl transferase family protein n=1 Tax=Chryseobacterium sp. MFBS3-17 TaxID=2886689 RepID=UPI001D0E27E9|nr:polysaccharide pyruvyl transferase family protein [Chryseobacterium sp. MFBS3-17]MCC2589424.1 polysaccharide pyruvyl transferase family protein [Chryseobacterium sp. MFBS3-17]